MFKRTSKVDNFKVYSAALTSVIQIGDSSIINCFSRAIAVQRQRELYFANEGDFAQYDIFFISPPLPPIEEQINIRTTSLQPLIKVDSMDVTAVSSSSILHIGSSEHIQCETRVMHIRQLEFTEEKDKNNTTK